MLWSLPLFGLVAGGLVVWAEWELSSALKIRNRELSSQSGHMAQAAVHVGMLSPAGKDTDRNKIPNNEGVEAPRLQGVKRANTGRIQPMSNAAGADGSAAEWGGYFDQYPKPRWDRIGCQVQLGSDVRVSMINASGQVLWSSIPALRGTRLQKNNTLCKPCHALKGQAAARLPRFVTGPAPDNEVYFATPLLNVGTCRSCHAADTIKLGVVYARRSAGWFDRLLLGLQLGLVFAGVLALVLTGLAWRVLANLAPPPAPSRPAPPVEAAPRPRRVTRPTGPLLPVGTPSTAVLQPVDTTAGPLVRSKTQQLRLNLQDTQRQQENLQTLYDIADELSTKSDPDARCRRVVQLVRSIFKSDSLLVAGHMHSQSHIFHGTITYGQGDAVPQEVPYPFEDIKEIAPYYDQVLVDRWLRGELDLTTRIVAGSTVAYPLERDGKRLGLFLVPARPRGEDRPTGANPQVVQALRKHLAAALELSELQRVLLKQERLAAIGATVAGLAHCLKNTLNGLKGGQYVVERALENKNEERLAQGWRVLKTGVGHIERLTLDMLMYAAERKLNPEPTDPNDTLNDVAELLRENAEHNGVAMVTDLDPRIGEVALDRVAIYRAVLNLASNAVDACTESERGDRVALRSALRGGSLVITVEDNGVGIPPEVLRRVSERFFTTKLSKGTGLGLPVVEKIAKLHNGALEIESEVGRGSSFHLVIPL